MRSSEPKIDVVGIGSALLDFTVEVEESFLEAIHLNKGHMHLIDEQQSEAIFKQLKKYAIEKTPGGSSANTIAGIALLGGSGLFVGKVGNDTNGQYYIEETERIGVQTRIGKHERMTGHAITFITPDSERTFATHLGASLHLTEDDVVDEDIQRGRILHIEGYLLENEGQREACFRAMHIAKEKGIKVSIDLADPALIGRNRDDFIDIVREFAAVVFVNDVEAVAFTGKEEEAALHQLAEMCDVAVVKLGSKGSMIKAHDAVCRIPAFRTLVENTNGAGDMYAAGVLYGIARNIPIERAGLIGSYAASRVVSQKGARLDAALDINKLPSI